MNYRITPLAQILNEYGLKSTDEYNLALEEIYGWKSASESNVTLTRLVDARTIEEAAIESGIKISVAKRFGHSGMKRLRKYALRRRTELGLAPL